MSNKPMVDTLLKIRLLQAFPEGYLLPVLHHYNKHFRKKNNNRAITQWNINDTITGRGCKQRGVILKCVSSLLEIQKA